MGQGNIAALTAEKPAISSLPRKNDSPDAEPWKLPLLSKLERISKICCVGAGYVGVPTSAMIASKNPHIKVTVFDTDDRKIRRWASDKPEDLPIHEPGLFKLISQVKSPAPLCYDLPFEDHSDPSKETSPTLSVNNDKENFNLTYDGPLLENLFRPVLHSLQLMKSATPQGMPDDNERGIVLKETLISVETHIGMLLQDVADRRDRETLDEKYWTYIFGYWPNQRTAMPKDIKDMSFRLVESERLEDRPSAATNGHSIGPNLIFTTDGNRAIEEADLIFISVDTPTKLHGIGEGFDADLTAVEAVARQIAQVSTNSKIVVEKSTVPCGTADKIREILKANANPGVEFIVLSNPEFLVEGNALENLLAPDRVVIGSHLTKDALLAAAKLANVYEAWIPKEKIITTDLWSSELSKLVANAMLAQRISSMNAVSAICEKVGADIDEVARIVGTDSRIGDRMLKAGVGFGGSCFQKDILNLVYLSRSLNLNDVADYWERIVHMNEAQKSRFLNRIITRLNNTLMNKKIAVLGFAFKKNTADSRASPAIEIVKGLAMEHAHVDIFDPLVPESTIREEMRSVNIAVGGLFIHSKVKVVETAYEACRNAHAIVILTDWDEFRVKECSSGPHEPPRLGYRDVQLSVLHLDEHPTQSTERLQVLVAPEDEKGLDWQRIAAHMHSPKWVFDGRNFLDTAELGEMGFCVEAVGRPA